MADTYIGSTEAGLGPELLIEANAAVVYAAHENSLFLNGQLIPIMAAPNGLFKVPKLSTPAADTIIAGSDITADVPVTNPVSSEVNGVCDLIAVRSVVRDLGSIAPTDIGQAGGQGVAAEWDAAVNASIGGLTSQDINVGDALALLDIYTAIATIRDAGETGQLFGLVNPTSYAEIMQLVGSAAFAGGDQFQSQVMRSGFLGNLAGVPMFVSTYFNAANTGLTAPRVAIWGSNALRIGMQRNASLEIGRRTEAVGWDVVSSIMAASVVVDAARGVVLNEEA